MTDHDVINWALRYYIQGLVSKVYTNHATTKAQQDEVKQAHEIVHRARRILMERSK